MTVSENQAIESILPEFAQHPLLQGSRRSPAMNQADAESANLDDLPIGDTLNGRIHVAAHDMNVAIGKSHQDIRIDDITGVQDDFDAGEVVFGQHMQKINPLFGIHDMCVRKHPDFQCHHPPFIVLAPIVGVCQL